MIAAVRNVEPPARVRDASRRIVLCVRSSAVNVSAPTPQRRHDTKGVDRADPVAVLFDDKDRSRRVDRNRIRAFELRIRADAVGRALGPCNPGHRCHKRGRIDFANNVIVLVSHEYDSAQRHGNAKRRRKLRVRTFSIHVPRGFGRSCERRHGRRRVDDADLVLHAV
jgi:hypothetical protein